MISPWYRSRMLWLGLPGLLILLWMWLGFQRSPVMASWSRQKQTTYAAACGEGMIRLARSGYTPPDLRRHSYEPSFFLRRFPLPPAHVVPVFPPAVGSSDESDIKEIRIAIWFITLIYLVLWGCLVTTWQRRKHRLMGDSIRAEAI